MWREDTDDHLTSPRNWKCKYCDRINYVKNPKCEVCETERPKLERMSLSTNNLNTYKTARAIVNTPLNMNSLPWSCPKCTMLNANDIEKCLACGECGPNHDKWRCENCTLVNDKLEKICSVCFNQNPLLVKCPKCEKVKINVKYNKMCQDCVRNEYVKERRLQLLDFSEVASFDNVQVFGNVKKMIYVEQWSCSKCSLRNSFQLVRCSACDNVGPHFDQWRCGRCTVFNHNSANMCCSCGLFKPFMENKYDSIGSKNEKDQLFKTSSKNNKTYDERICECCKEVYSTCDGRLCQKCKRQYYICPFSLCEKLVRKDQRKCDFCGINIWKCPWIECKHYNDQKIDLCTNCCCFRDVTNRRIKCANCGWIKSRETKCFKCGDSFA